MPFGLFDLRSKPSVIGRIVTATVTLVTVLIVYDGWATLKFFDVVLIVLGPIVAVVTAHVFLTVSFRRWTSAGARRCASGSRWSDLSDSTAGPQVRFV